MAYSYDQLVALWQNNCPSNAQLAPTMAAIALAESGGNPSAVGDQYPIDGVYAPSYGLWQIRSVHADAIPNFFPQQGSSEWSNPAQNASAACSVYSAQGLSAWSTYSNGAYKKFLPGGVSPNAQPAGANPLESFLQGVGTTAENIAGGIVSDVGAGLDALFGGAVSPFLRLPQSLINIGWNFAGFSIGVALIAIGGLLLAMSVFETIGNDVLDRADQVIAKIPAPAAEAAIL